MSRFASLVPFAFLLVPSFLVGCNGCKKDETVSAQPTPEATAAPNASAKAKPNLRNAVAPMPKIDPQAMKDYRLEVCYFGTLTLRQARDAYFASLGKDEPSEKKIPNFGAPPMTPAGSILPVPVALGSASAGPAAKPLSRPPIPAPSGSAAAGRRIADMGLRAPHERNARACTVAAGLKDPVMADVDAALKDFAPFALELARNVAAASIYYQRDEFKKDQFAKGKELHTKLTADFAKLDEVSDKLAAAMAAHRKEHPADLSKLEEGEKAVVEAYENARNVVLSLVGNKIDAAGYKAAIETMEKSMTALKGAGEKNSNDTWVKITAPAFEAFLRTLRDGEAKVSDKGIASDSFLQIVNSFTSVIEAKHRALSRALIAKGQTIETRPNPGIGRPNAPILRPQLEKDGHDHEKH